MCNSLRASPQSKARIFHANLEIFDNNLMTYFPFEFGHFVPARVEAAGGDIGRDDDMFDAYEKNSFESVLHMKMNSEV
jgi:hypothetical protein